MTSLIDNLLRQAKAAPDSPALISEDMIMTWGELADASLRYATVLRGSGIAAGDRVAILCPNRPAYLICWLALANIGAVAVSINIGLVGRGLRHSLVQAKCRTILADAALWQDKSADLDEVAADRTLLTFTDESDLLARLTDVPRDAVFDGDPASPFSIIYTSGTTGFPKGVINSQTVFVASGRWMVQFLHITAADRIMVFLPLFHTNPQMYAVASALETGCALILRPKFSASGLFEDARRFGATAFTYVGTVLSMLCRRQTASDTQHSVTRCVGGGCPPDIFDAMRDRFGVTVHELYGMTEIGGWVTGTRTHAVRRGTCGEVRPDMKVRVVDANDSVCPTGTRGEIVVRPGEPDIMFAGYDGNPEASWAAVRNLWYHTGDAGSFDADGFLTFHGRMGEIIRRGGENISPIELETVLLEHPEITDAACVGILDDIWGQEVKVAVVADGLTAAEVRSFLSGRIADFMLPRYVQFVAEIPRTATEKIRREVLKDAREGEVDLAETASAQNG